MAIVLARGSLDVPGLAAPNGATTFSAPDDVASGQRRFVAPLAERTAWHASDGFQSHRLPDGRTLWLYGDTITDDGRIVRNSMSIWDRRRGYLRFDAGADLRGFARRPGTGASDAGTRWYWTGVPLPDTGSALVHIPAMRVQHTTEGLGFVVTGSDMVTYRYRSANASLSRVASNTLPRVLDASGTEVVWWGAATVRVDPYVYVYGMMPPAPGPGYSNDVAVMRVPTRVIRSRAPRMGDWQVRTRAGWRRRTTLTEQQVLHVGRRFSNSFGVVAVGGRLYAVVLTDEFMGRYVNLYRAASTGSPFRFCRHLASVPRTPGTFTYNVNLHPTLPAPAGSTWITVNQNPAGCRAMVCPTLYRPIFRRIPAPNRFPMLSRNPRGTVR